MKSTFRLEGVGNEQGSALITTILILVVVTVIGIIASKTADIELQIAGHDKVHKMTWFATDAVVDGFVPGLLEQAIEERVLNDEDLASFFPVFSPAITLNNFDFWNNLATDVCLSDTPYPGNADIELSAEAMGKTDLYLKAYGPTEPADGTSILTTEGYHGFGKSLAKGGAHITFTIRGLGVGEANTEARVASQWRYVIQ